MPLSSGRERASLLRHQQWCARATRPKLGLICALPTRCRPTSLPAWAGRTPADVEMALVVAGAVHDCDPAHARASHAEQNLGRQRRRPDGVGQRPRRAADLEKAQSGLVALER